MSPEPSPCFSIAPTPYGGRGAFASKHIPKDTLILSCEAPYASVVCRKFRKEVCAWCFSWSWEVARKGNWSISVPLEPQRVVNGSTPRKNVTGNGPNGGVWFCQEKCRNDWIDDGEDMELDSDTGHAGVRGLVNAALERCLTTMEKGKTRPRTTPASNGIELGWVSFLQTLEDLESGDDISPTFLEDTWERAEQLSSFSRSSTPTVKDVVRISGRENAKMVPLSPTILSEFELDTARFVLSGLLRRCISLSHTATSLANETSISTNSAGAWLDVLDLQDNTLLHVQSKPHILASNVRVWAFIKFVVHSASTEVRSLSEKTKHLVQVLKKSVDSPHDTRAILGREHGNVFGIWDMAPEGVDSEMLGWGLYPFGSYFNHDCEPSLHKKRQGRVMEYYALRDVCAGEELCISYVDNDEGVDQRRKALREWFFACGCLKCKTELASGGA
ncbi:SET domain-containing protein [Macrolepiota fuliginosa MF-IS2]|uniref:SET domain-containing protein n=1 Tax=Macrolepiota fuliginosa MF-IS2 TaxID=1400762 RepID=A0A9P5XAZ9_9AGAR|nr:SET domain-containing protein [Macrolepiota fuliginosa MF-IS2]